MNTQKATPEESKWVEECIKLFFRTKHKWIRFKIPFTKVMQERIVKYGNRYKLSKNEIIVRSIHEWEDSNFLDRISKERMLWKMLTKSPTKISLDYIAGMIRGLDAAKEIFNDT